MRTSLLASAATPFAHLLRRPVAAKPAAAEDDEKKDEKEEARRARNKKAGRAEDDDGDPNASAEDDDSGDDTMQKGKTAKGKKKCEGDGESDEEDDADESARAIRMRERGRCAAIFADPAAAKRPDMAAHVAFMTNMNRDQAITMLRAVAAGEPEPPPAARVSRMASAPNPDVGGGGAPAKPGGDPDAAFAARAVELARTAGRVR
jgi:hypothetical protein